MQKIKEFLQGKKTYLSATFIALVAIVGWWYGVLDDTKALALLGVAGVGAGLGAKSQRTAETILTVLGDIRSLQAKAAASGQKIDPKQFVADLSKQLMSQFATGGLVRSTPVGAVSNVVLAAGDNAGTVAVPGTPFVGGPTVTLSPSDGSAVQGESTENAAK